jgi:structure-specific recognition protein 1
MYFVIGLEKPLRQGNTSYNYLVMQFKKEQRETINVKVTPEQIQELYDGKIKESYDGPLFDTVAKLFKAIIKINIIIPGEFMR